LSLASIYSLVILIAGKAGAYLNEAPFRSSTVGDSPGLTPKY